MAEDAVFSTKHETRNEIRGRRAIPSEDVDPVEELKRLLSEH
jgi:hypothetical protein